MSRGNSVNTTPSLDELVEIFRTEWHRADAKGLAGERVKTALSVVLDRLNVSVENGSGSA
jgi:hypothetical protein